MTSKLTPPRGSTAIGTGLWGYDGVSALTLAVAVGLQRHQANVCGTSNSNGTGSTAGMQHVRGAKKVSP